MIDAGVGILQWRSKSLLTRAALEQIETIAEMCATRGVAFVVNDRVDVAMLIGAGVHVGQDDLSPGDVRRLIGPNAQIGFSTHNPVQFLAATREPVDYLALGPVYGTSTKEKPDPMVGLEPISECRTMTSLPLVAIGGITLDTALPVLDAGADSVAVIGGLIPSELTQDSLRRRVEQWLSLLG